MNDNKPFIVVIVLSDGKRLPSSKHNIHLKNKYITAYNTWVKVNHTLHAGEFPPPIKQALEQQEIELRDAMALHAQHYNSFNGYFGFKAVTADMNIN
jgi:hypothetical protein